MNYQWYPGHMTKARRMMEENLKLIDLIIELIDARIPESSRNPDIDRLGNGKSRLLILNKADLAEKAKLSTPVISGIENGHSKVWLITFAKICEALQVSADDVLRLDTPCFSSFVIMNNV